MGSEDTRAIRAFRFSQMVEGQPVDLYVAAVPAATVIRWFNVDAYDPGGNPGGYQRRPVEARFREIARYIRSQEGLLPTAILVNLRDPAEFTPDDPEGSVGLLRIPEGSPWWVVDGQHRVYGLKRAIEEVKAENPDAELPYEVPVVFTVGLDKFTEMRLFHIVNSKQKGVPTDLAADLLSRAVTKVGREFLYRGKGKEKDLRKAVGVAVARHLNSAPGPWQGRIRLPNEPVDRRRKPLQVNAVAASLEPALRDKYVEGLWNTKAEFDQEWPTLKGIVFTYWYALAELMPDAFADVENYSVQRTTGVYVFHLLLPDVLHRCAEAKDFSVQRFKEILRHLGRWVDSQTWHLHEGDPSTRSTGMASIRRLADELRDQLPRLETPGLEPPAERRRAEEVVQRAGVVYGD